VGALGIVDGPQLWMTSRSADYFGRLDDAEHSRRRGIVTPSQFTTPMAAWTCGITQTRWALSAAFNDMGIFR
jgi:hypothetical protein